MTALTRKPLTASRGCYDGIRAGLFACLWPLISVRRRYIFNLLLVACLNNVKIYIVSINCFPGGLPTYISRHELYSTVYKCVLSTESLFNKIDKLNRQDTLLRPTYYIAWLDCLPAVA